MNLDNILLDFVSNDCLRPIMQIPNKIGNFVYATNAHILCKIPVNCLLNSYMSNEKYPNVVGVMESHLSVNESIEVVLNNDRLISLISQIKKRRYCNECDEYKSASHTCFDINCDISEIYDPNATVVIEDVYFSPEYLEKIIAISVKINRPITYFSKGLTKCNFFKIGEIVVGIMPKAHDNYFEKHIYHSDLETAI